MKMLLRYFYLHMGHKFYPLLFTKCLKSLLSGVKPNVRIKLLRITCFICGDTFKGQKKE